MPIDKPKKSKMVMDLDPKEREAWRALGREKAMERRAGRAARVKAALASEKKEPMVKKGPSKSPKTGKVRPSGSAPSKRPMTVKVRPARPVGKATTVTRPPINPGPTYKKPPAKGASPKMVGKIKPATPATHKSAAWASAKAKAESLARKEGWTGGKGVQAWEVKANLKDMPEFKSERARASVFSRLKREADFSLSGALRKARKFARKVK